MDKQQDIVQCVFQFLPKSELFAFRLVHSLWNKALFCPMFWSHAALDNSTAFFWNMVLPNYFAYNSIIEKISIATDTQLEYFAKLGTAMKIVTRELILKTANLYPFTQYIDAQVIRICGIASQDEANDLVCKYKQKMVVVLEFSDEKSVDCEAQDNIIGLRWLAYNVDYSEFVNLQELYCASISNEQLATEYPEIAKQLVKLECAMDGSFTSNGAFTSLQKLTLHVYSFVDLANLLPMPWLRELKYDAIMVQGEQIAISLSGFAALRKFELETDESNRLVGFESSSNSNLKEIHISAVASAKVAKSIIEQHPHVKRLSLTVEMATKAMLCNIFSTKYRYDSVNIKYIVNNSLPQAKEDPNSTVYTNELAVRTQLIFKNMFASTNNSVLCVNLLQHCTTLNIEYSQLESMSITSLPLVTSLTTILRSPKIIKIPLHQAFPNLKHLHITQLSYGVGRKHASNLADLFPKASGPMVSVKNLIVDADIISNTAVMSYLLQHFPNASKMDLWFPATIADLHAIKQHDLVLHHVRLRCLRIEALVTEWFNIGDRTKQIVQLVQTNDV